MHNKNNGVGTSITPGVVNIMCVRLKKQLMMMSKGCDVDKIMVHTRVMRKKHAVNKCHCMNKIQGNNTTGLVHSISLVCTLSMLFVLYFTQEASCSHLSPAKTG